MTGPDLIPTLSEEETAEIEAEEALTTMQKNLCSDS